MFSRGECNLGEKGKETLCCQSEISNDKEAAYIVIQEFACLLTNDLRITRRVCGLYTNVYNMYDLELQ